MGIINYYLTWAGHNSQEETGGDFEPTDFVPILCPRNADWFIGRSQELAEMDRGGHLPIHFHPVTSCLQRMLDSSLAYPLALAFAQDEMAAQKLENPAEVFGLAESLLKRHYQEQPSAPYFLALATKSTTAHFPNGQFYWLVGPASGRGLNYEEERVLALSGDMQIYPTPVDFWEVEKSLLAEKFGSAFM